MKPTDLTEAEIARKLDGQFIAATRTFQGKPLAEYTRGTRLLVARLAMPGDRDGFLDALILKVLLALYDPTEDGRRQRRAELLAAAENVHAIRGEVLDLIDGWSDEDVVEAARVVREIEEEVARATVAVKGSVIDTKKKPGAVSKRRRSAR